MSDKANQEEQEEEYRETKLHELQEKMVAEPTFMTNQFLYALFNHVMFQMLFGPLWTMILLIFRGKIYAGNYGFHPIGPFKLAFMASMLYYGLYMFTVVLLILAWTLSDLDQGNLRIYPFIVCTLVIFTRQIIISLRHGSTSPSVYNKEFPGWSDRKEAVPAVRCDSLLRLIWIEISPAKADQEISR